MKRLAISIALVALFLTDAEAQSDSVLTRALSDTTSLLGRLSQESSPVKVQKFEVQAIRLSSASGGFVFGMVLGGFAGHEISDADCTRNCRRPAGEALLTGAAIGGTVGAALGAAFLNLESVCGFNRRILRTVIGTAVGASALFAATGGLEERRGRSAFFIPIGAIGGSLATLGPCWKSRY
jgi:hypothetical protein